MAPTNDPGVFPVSLEVKDGEWLVVEWSDGMRQQLSWSVLRRNCPCAGCRAEREKPAPVFQILKIEEAQPTRPRSIVPVGRYAYQFHWSDGHESGIYTFDTLRQLKSDQKPASEQ